MRRSVLVGALALAAFASRAEAQLSMQMSNGWSFTFAGNVNAFYVWDQAKGQTTPGTYETVAKNSGIGTGLLPAFATFEAKGKEGNTDLSAFFGFAPQVSAGNGTASYFGADAAGAQIDMRQVYLTAGGKWGSILAGKQIGLYQRSNIVEDMTIYGLGPNCLVDAACAGGNRGTSLGRIGFGYEYTDFRPQITYTSAAGKKHSFSIGLFSPLDYGVYNVQTLPRLEADFNWKGGGKTTLYFDVSGFVQQAKDAVSDAFATQGTSVNSVTPAGGAATVKVGFSRLTIVGSGYYSTAGCTLFMGNSVVGGGPLGCDGVGDIPDANGVVQLRSGFGWYAQAVFATQGKWMFGASYGGNYLNQNTEDKAAGTDNPFFKSRTAIIGQVTYKATKSLRGVLEYTYSQVDVRDPAVNLGPGASAKYIYANQVGVGLMLFY
jgi:hypothetical protein